MLTYTLNHFELFLLVLLRMVAFIGASPILSLRAWPVWAKLGFAAFIAMVVTPTLHVTSPLAFADPGNYILAGLRETAVGLLLGFVASMIVSVITIAGQIFDIQIGLSSASVFDPQAAQSTITSTFQSMLFTLYFLGLGGLDGFVLVIMNSYHFLGFNHWFLPTTFVGFLTHLLGVVMTLAVELIAPLLATLLMTDITFAFLSRAVPQMNVFVVGLPAKLFVGLSMLAIAMPATVYLFGQLFQTMFSQLNVMMQWLGG